jgi:ABC-2 type transport system ATP-binding protein
VLQEDAALGGVVSALGGLGAQILALRKSEPTLEDVFVELVGRGFEEAGDDDGSSPDETPPKGRAAADEPHREDEPASEELV